MQDARWCLNVSQINWNIPSYYYLAIILFCIYQQIIQIVISVQILLLNFLNFHEICSFIEKASFTNLNEQYHNLELNSI